MTVELPQLCKACIRFDGLSSCTSFPEGIPESILVWSGDHRTSLAGEPPFEADPAKPEALNDWLAYSPNAHD